jgi:predicted esterase
MQKTLLCLTLFFLYFFQKTPAQNAQNQPIVPFSLDELQHRTFNFFWETVDKNSQVPDRFPTMNFTSVAATGFGLSSYLVGVERGYITREQAAERVLKTLEVLFNLPQNGEATPNTSGFKGFFYHFLDHEKALRFKQVELSSIDTGLLMAGVLSCMTYFDKNNETEQKIRELADNLYRSVDWQWFTDGNKSGLIRMGWTPENGFHDRYWDGYNEAMIIYILALGSPTHSVSPDCWEAWCHRYPYKNFMGLEQVNFGPLFGHQYSHIWLDFKGIQDKYMASKGIDYFENSRRATIANRLYCMANPNNFKGYDENIWGLTACDGPGYKETTWNGKPMVFQGYSARGAATDEAFDDGTIAPTAAGGSVPFAPKECIASLKAQWENYYPNLVGKYGFKDAYNPSYTFGKGNENGWFDIDYLGIDQGPILLQIENYRSQLIWNLMRKNPYIVAGLKRAGFKGGWLEETKIEVPKQTNVASVAKKERYKAPDPKELFDKITYNKHDKFINLRLLKPQQLSKEKYPLVVFLHGSGERGSDNEAQLKNAVLAFAETDFQAKYPCYVAVPQCPVGQKWSDYELQNDVFWRDKITDPSAALMDWLEDFLNQHPDIDRNRIYLTGLSMGGLGTFDLLMRYPKTFAAAIPVCGGGEPTKADLIKHIPLWVTHGALDPVVPVEYSRNMVAALKKVGSKKVKYTEYSTLNHFVWQETFYNPRILEWLFGQRKR